MAYSRFAIVGERSIARLAYRRKRALGFAESGELYRGIAIERTAIYVEVPSCSLVYRYSSWFSSQRAVRSSP